MSNTNNNYHSVDRITVTKKTLFDSSQEYVYVTIEAGDDLHSINLFNNKPSLYCVNLYTDL